MPDGQPFGLGPAGVAVAAQHASIYARPWRRSAYRPSRPATTAPDGARVPAVRGVRLHDLWHTFATMQSVGGCAFHAGVKVVGTQHL